MEDSRNCRVADNAEKGEVGKVERAEGAGAVVRFGVPE